MKYRAPWRHPISYLPLAVMTFGLLRSPEPATPLELSLLAVLLVVHALALGASHVAYVKRMRELDDFYRKTLGKEPPRQGRQS